MLIDSAVYKKKGNDIWDSGGLDFTSNRKKTVHLNIMV